MRLYARFAVALMIVGLAAPVVRGDEDSPLGVGDKAPEITVGSWVKGGPIESLEGDKVYVVEFWATWCGPCITSIPHLSELQKQYKDKGVEIIGVSVFETDPERVEPFVEEMGDKMEYNVAKDLVPEGGDRSEGKMATNWMQAAEEGGIPTAFIVQNGTIAWIGHPMQMDDPLEKIVAGDYDIAAAAAERQAAKVRVEKMATMQQSLMSAIRAEEFDKAVEIIDQALADDPGMEGQLGFMKLTVLQQAGQRKTLATYADHLVSKVYNESPEALNVIAWMLIDPDLGADADKAAIEVALKAAERANEQTDGKEPPILDTLARAHFVAGDPETALEIQRKAVDLAGDAADPELAERLEQYKKVVEDKK